MRGGKRLTAGRPKVPENLKKIPTSFSLSEKDLERLDAINEKWGGGRTRSQLISAIIQNIEL